MLRYVALLQLLGGLLCLAAAVLGFPPQKTNVTAERDALVVVALLMLWFSAELFGTAARRPRRGRRD